MTSNIARLSQWTIVDAKNQSNNRAVTPFDDVAFRIPFGSYMQVEQSSLISANGHAIQEQSTFKLIKADIPFLPDWLVKRPYLNHNQLANRSRLFLTESGGRNFYKYEEEPKQLGEYPRDIQETLLIEDLLYVMSSIEGVYIKRKKKESEYNGQVRYVYEVEPYLESSTCDFSILYLIGKILPMCNNHDKVVEFANIHSQFEYGRVSQALCGAINILLKEYLLLVTQLDTEFMKSQLTLQKIWAFIQPSMRIMENLYKLSTECVNKKGGEVLNIIYKFLTNTSDKSIKELFAFLLEKTSVPFIEILQKWIYQGVLEDPFGEFLIKEDTEQNKYNIAADF